MFFKIYDIDVAFQDYAIWQVARATSAATTFKSIQLGCDKIKFTNNVVYHPAGHITQPVTFTNSTNFRRP
jgi:hypothetical protein